MSPASTWQRSPEVLSRRSLDAWLLLAPGGDGPVTLAATAADVWDLLTEPMTVSDLVDELGRRYEAEDEVLRADISLALEEMAGKGLIRLQS